MTTDGAAAVAVDFVAPGSVALLSTPASRIGRKGGQRVAILCGACSRFLPPVGGHGGEISSHVPDQETIPHYADHVSLNVGSYVRFKVPKTKIRCAKRGKSLKTGVFVKGYFQIALSSSLAQNQVSITRRKSRKAKKSENRERNRFWRAMGTSRTS